MRMAEGPFVDKIVHWSFTVRPLLLLSLLNAVNVGSAASLIPALWRSHFDESWSMLQIIHVETLDMEGRGESRARNTGNGRPTEEHSDWNLRILERVPWGCGRLGNEYGDVSPGCSIVGPACSQISPLALFPNPSS